MEKKRVFEVLSKYCGNAYDGEENGEGGKCPMRSGAFEMADDDPECCAESCPAIKELFGPNK